MGDNIKPWPSGQVAKWPGIVLVGMLAICGCDKLMPKSPKPQAAAPAAEANEGLPSRPAAAAAETLATVNSKPITTDDLQTALNEYKARYDMLHQAGRIEKPWAKFSESELSSLLDQLILQELQAQDALAYGLGRTKPEVKARFWRMVRAFFASEWQQWQLDDQLVAVTDEEARRFYDAAKAKLYYPELITVRQFVFSSEKDAQAAVARFYNEGEDVEVLRLASIRPEASRGSLTEQWIARAGEQDQAKPGDAARTLLDDRLEKAAFAIDTKGALSTIVKGADNAYNVFQLVDRRPRQDQPFSEVADRITTLLRDGKLKEKMKALKEKAAIETFAERLATVEQP